MGAVVSREAAVVSQSAVRRGRRGVVAAFVIAAGWGEKGSVRPVESVATVPLPAAVLALQVSDSVAVWFTSARADTSAEGRACLERVMEIRAGTQVVPVPLLYTGENPIPNNDSTIQVHIWRHCVAADLYRVHLRTGQPTRVVP